MATEYESKSLPTVAPVAPPAAAPAQWGLLRDGQMAERLRAFPWESTPIGPIESWPQSLRLAVGICMNSRFPMFVWWGPSMINIYNEAYVPVLGKKHPAALGAPAKSLWAEIWDVVGPQAEGVLQRGEATWNERVLLLMERHGYLEETWFTWSYSPIPDESGGIGGLFCACIEDTPLVHAEQRRDRMAEELDEARKRLEATLAAEQKARAEAESANRAKDKFLAVLSHELRTPLSPVAMTIPAIEMDPELPPKFRADMAMIRRNIELEVKLIDDLLDLSRVTNGKLRLQLQPVRLHEVLRHAIYNSVSDTSGKRLQVRETLEAGNDWVTADPARLQQVFWNLLRNAVKFTPTGGRITIRTWNDESGDVHVEVGDNGVGIDEALLPRIFDAFEQGDTRVTRQFGGLGLGLAIVKAVVEMHGGGVSATSAGRGMGATFTIRLNTSAAEEALGADGAVAAAQDGKHGGRRVLLVEDHPDTARTLARILRASAWEVETAGTVAAALSVAARKQFDIVLSDIGLPDATGYELMGELRSRYGLKGIALSGYGMEEDMRKSMRAGFEEHIIKPVNVPQLEAAMQRVVRLG